ncbi:MAG: hypothetical protein JWQ09_1718 [Segetibacter sp.]|nr:hypothetical protein [Segetibacter sp.]
MKKKEKQYSQKIGNQWEGFDVENVPQKSLLLVYIGM